MRVTYPAPARAGHSDALGTSTHPVGRDPATRRDAHPAIRLVLTFLAAYAVLTAACIGLGLLITDAAATAGIRHWDVSVNRWFVRQRTGAIDSMTAVGSHLAETPTVIAVGLVVVALVWWRRRDLYAVGILVVGLTLEVTVFVTTTLFVDRPRPPVHRLDTAPPTSSFPSGHTAAAIVLYIGLIIVVHRVWRRNAATIGVAVVLALVPVAVGLSRLSRGMHHPTDVIAGALLGTVALLVACAVVGRAVARPAASDRTTGARKVRT